MLQIFAKIDNYDNDITLGMINNDDKYSKRFSSFLNDVLLYLREKMKIKNQKKNYQRIKNRRDRRLENY